MPRKDRRELLKTGLADVGRGCRGLRRSGQRTEGRRAEDGARRRADVHRRRGHVGHVPGAPHLLHRPQLRGARARDGLGSHARAAVLLPEADRRDPERRRRAPSPTTRTRRSPRTTTTRSSSSRRSTRAAATSRRRRALECVYAYAVGLDMTRRDLQRAMGDEKKPWEIGKSFDRSAPIGPLHPALAAAPLEKGAIWLKVNGVTKQNANLNQMIWSVAEQISKLSEAFELMPGDIIYSGTPENVGPGGQGRRHRVPHRRAAESERQGRVRTARERATAARSALRSSCGGPRHARLRLRDLRPRASGSSRATRRSARCAATRRRWSSRAPRSSSCSATTRGAAITATATSRRIAMARLDRVRVRSRTRASTSTPDGPRAVRASTRRSCTTGSCSPTRTSRRARKRSGSPRAARRSCTSRSTTWRARSPTPMPTARSSCATTASPTCTRCRRSSWSPGRPYPVFLRYLAEHGYYGDGDVDALVARACASLRNPTGEAFEDRTPDGRVYRILRRRAEGGGTVTVITDVTDFKRAEEALARKEAVLHAALDNMPGALVYTDADLDIVICNGRVRRVVSGAGGTAASRASPIRRCFATSPRTATTARATSTRTSRDASRACAIPTGVAFEDRAPDGRVYRIARRRAADGGTVTVMTRHHRAQGQRGDAARGHRRRPRKRTARSRTRTADAGVAVGASCRSTCRRRSTARSSAARSRPRSSRSARSSRSSSRTSPGFTETTDMLESEELTNLLNQYLREMSSIALEYGATIDKFIGDAIMLFFGDPRDARPARGRDRMRAHGDRNAAAHARPAGRVARARPGARVPAAHRHQHGLLHGRQLRQQRARRLHDHRQRGEPRVAPAAARRPGRHPARARDVRAGEGRRDHRGDRHDHGEGLCRSRCARIASSGSCTTRRRPRDPQEQDGLLLIIDQRKLTGENRAEARRRLREAADRLED